MEGNGKRRDAIAKIDIDHRRVLFQRSRSARRQKMPISTICPLTLYTKAATMLGGWMREWKIVDTERRNKRNDMD